MTDDKNITDDEDIKKETAEAVNEDSEAVTEETVEEKAEGDETEESSEEAEESSEDAEGSKGFFKKNKKEKKDKKDEQIEELTDKYKRVMAEFDNFRKRTELEKSAMYEIGARDIIEKILPVKDNFERGLNAIPEGDKDSDIAVGMDKIYKQLAKMLEDAGVSEIEAEGAEFDPELHNAVMHIEDESFGENVIAEVFEKGYTYKGKVVRHSMVKVAN